jgi:general stress protein 26
MKSETNQNPKDSIQKLGELLKDIKFAMFTTIDLDGSLYSRPMASQHQEFDGDLWFFSNRSSGKIRSIEKDQHVNLAYASPDDSRYVSVSGRAEIVKDHAKMEELWNPMFKAWFPEGLEDPELTLIRVRVESAEYWDSPSKMIVRLVGFAKSLVSGTSYNPGAHQKVQLRH